MREMKDFFFRLKHQLWIRGGETCCAFVYYWLKPIWHRVTSSLIPVLQRIQQQQQSLCESEDKCLHNSNASDSVVLPNVFYN